MDDTNAGRYTEAGDRYHCHDCQSNVWSPAHHDEVHARYDREHQPGETLAEWNQRMVVLMIETGRI